MKKKVSIKQHLKVGSLIRTDWNDFYEITRLGERTFDCIDVNLIGTELEETQKFYYNIKMVVYEKKVQN